MFDRCPALPDTPKGPVVTPLAETATVVICKHRYAGVAHICVVSATLHVPSSELYQFVYKEKNLRYVRAFFAIARNG